MTDRKVSIIIPLHKPSDRFRNDFNAFLGLDYPNYEIIVVHDNGATFRHERAITCTTKKEITGPAEKRDVALKTARGDLCAFIDDDAYPDKNWLKRAVGHFDDESIGAVGGPGLTPPEDTFMMKAGGLCYESFFGSGAVGYRFERGRRRFVRDYPAYNLLVRKSVCDALGGFQSTFYGGEDTKLCLDIINLGKKIAYDPDVIVYHHRRRLFGEHLRQVGNVGLHRGYFFRKFPKTSRKLFYMMPLLFVLYLWVLLLSILIRSPYTVLLLVPLLVLLIGSYADCLRRSRQSAMAIVAVFGIVSMHFVYGVNFIRGLLTKELLV